MQYIAIPVKIQTAKPNNPGYAETPPPVLPNSVVQEILGSQKKVKVFDTQTKDIALRVLEICKNEYSNSKLRLPITWNGERASMYTGVSLSTLKNIKAEDRRRKEAGNSKQPFLRVRRRRAFKTVLDDRDMIIIKNLIRDHYIKHTTVPAIPKLLLNVVDEISTYRNNAAYLHKILRHIGYVRKRYYSKRWILIENPEIIASRDNYLETMRNLRNETKNIFYIYECVIDRSFTLHKSWVQKYGSNDGLKDKNTFTFVCAVSKNGFLEKSGLLRRTDIEKHVQGFCGRMTPKFFERWLNLYLIPNLPEHSVVVIEGAPHQSVLKDKPISCYAGKNDMMEYLRKNEIKYDEENMTRTELYKLIEKNTPKHKVYVVDNILEVSGHKAMRLPPFMVNLSPAQHAMDDIQQKLFENEQDTVFDLKPVLAVLEKFTLCITPEEWSEYFEKVRLLEDEYWKKDGEFEVAIDKVLLNLRDCVDTGSEESDLESDSDYS